MIRLTFPALLIGLGAACMPVPHTFEPVEEFPIVRASQQTPAPPRPDRLRVLTWNLKFGGGRIDFFFDGWGDRVHMTEAEVQENLQGIYDLIDEKDPDVLLAQEVDVQSKRSAFVDMSQEILDQTAFNYMAWVPAWDVDYIPQNGLGKVKMGQAVFSKYPIVRNTRVDLPQSEASSTLVNTFWLHRAVQVTEIDLGDRVLTAINNHPTAYALDGTKQVHLGMIHERSAGAPAPMITGGDFNVIPPGSLRLTDFADEADTNTPGVTKVSYTEAEMAAMEPFYERWQAAIPLADYQVETEAEQERFLSHSVSGSVFWTQKLDYLFTTERWSEAVTLQKPGDGDPPLVSDPMTLSDHAPMFAVLELQ